MKSLRCLYQVMQTFVNLQRTYITHQRFIFRIDLSAQFREVPWPEGIGIYPVGDLFQDTPVSLFPQHINGHFISGQNGIGLFQDIFFNKIERDRIILVLMLGGMQNHFTLGGIAIPVKNGLETSQIKRLIFQIDDIRPDFFEQSFQLRPEYSQMQIAGEKNVSGDQVKQLIFRFFQVFFTTTPEFFPIRRNQHGHLPTTLPGNLMRQCLVEFLDK